MNEREKYLFDLQGYIVLENVLSPEELQACNDAINAQMASIQRRSGDHLLSGGSDTLQGDQGRGDIGGMLSWPKPHCEIWRALLVQPRVVDFLREILDDGFRLDHLYGILMTAGTEGHVLVRLSSLPKHSPTAHCPGIRQTKDALCYTNTRQEPSAMRVITYRVESKNSSTSLRQPSAQCSSHLITPADPRSNNAHKKGAHTRRCRSTHLRHARSRNGRPCTGQNAVTLLRIRAHK